MEGYFIDNSGKKVQAIFKIPILQKYFIDFIKLQQGVRVELENGEKLKLSAEETQKFVFQFSEQTVEMVALKNSLKLKPATGGAKDFIFLPLILSGKNTNLYLYFQTYGTSGMAAHGESFTGSITEKRNVLKINEEIAKINFEGKTNYIFQNSKGEFFQPTENVFDTDLAKYFENCEAVARNLNDASLKKYKVSEMVQSYNDCQ